MFNLSLDIDYIIAAFVILTVLYTITKNKYSGVTLANRIFYQMVLCSIITCIFNILMNISVTYYNYFHSFGYMLFRLLFNCGTSTITVLGYKYARMYQNGRKQISNTLSDIITIVLYVSYIILSVINMFTGIIASIDDTGIHHGPLFLLNTIIPALIFVMVLFIIYLNKSDYNKIQRRSIAIYFLLTFLFVGIELATNNVAPLTMFGVAISLIVIQQSLISPEYIKLEKSLADSEAAKKLALEAQADAEEANNAKSSFLARMSHEIRTPLNAVIGFNSIIAKETTDESIKNYSNDAKIAGENLLSLINDILDLSKIESGKLTLIDGDYSFSKLIFEEYLLFSLKAQEKGLELNFDIDKNIPTGLYGDDIRIKQIITNILSNAIKYTPHGSVSLKASLVSTDQNNASVHIEISDTGMGIKEEDLGKLFDAFERIEEKRNRKIEGTGLGVNICASLLSMMGSKLIVDSVYGSGSTFSFTLNQKITDPTPVGPFNPNASFTDIEGDGTKDDNELSEYPNAHILVVDDTALNLKVIKGLLKKSKITIDTASSASTALSLTLVNKYDLIFMDHIMPETDGIEAMNQIRAQKDGLNTETTIVVLTANAIKGAYEEYIGYGFADALFKPVKLNELNKILNKYLQ